MDHDIAALVAGLNRTATARVDHQQGIVEPPGFAPAKGDQLFLDESEFHEGQPNDAKLWIMKPGYSAARLDTKKFIGLATELAHWNGRRVFLIPDLSGRFAKAINTALANTSGPLVANIIAGEKSLELELINQSDKPLQMVKPFSDELSVNLGWNVIADDFRLPEAFDDSPTDEQIKARVFTLGPGQRKVWPMSADIAAGSDAKVDGGYFVDAREAKKLSVLALSVYAPTMRAHRDAAGRFAVTPWKLTPLTAVESAKSRRLAGFAESWFESMQSRVARDFAPDTLIQDFPSKDHVGDACDLRCVINSGAAAVVVEAIREQDLHGLAIGDTMDPIKWDGQQTDRAYRVPGSDWILRAQVPKGTRPEVQKAIDAEFNAFLKAAKEK